MDENKEEKQEEVTSKETAPKKEGFFSKLGKKFKEMCDETNEYIDRTQQKYELGKEFDAEAIELTDLDTGDVLKVLCAPTGFTVRKKPEFSHAYYSLGVTYRLRDRDPEAKVEYTKEGKEGALECFALDSEIVVNPIDNRAETLDRIEKLLSEQKPNALGFGNADREQAQKQFSDFRKAIDDGKADYGFIHDFVRSLGKFSPEAAKLAAALVYSVR